MKNNHLHFMYFFLSCFMHYLMIRLGFYISHIVTIQRLQHIYTVPIRIFNSMGDQLLALPSTILLYISDPRTWELVAPTMLPCESTHNQARHVGVFPLPRFDFTPSTVMPRLLESSTTSIVHLVEFPSPL